MKAAYVGSVITAAACIELVYIGLPYLGIVLMAGVSFAAGYAVGTKHTCEEFNAFVHRHFGEELTNGDQKEGHSEPRT